MAGSPLLRAPSPQHRPADTHTGGVLEPLDRSRLQRSLAVLSALLACLSDVHAAQAQLAGAHKKLAKAARDARACFQHTASAGTGTSSSSSNEGRKVAFLGKSQSAAARPGSPSSRPSSPAGSNGADLSSSYAAAAAAGVDSTGGARLLAASFGACASMLDALAEHGAKCATQGERDFNKLNDKARDAFKKVAKEERSHDDAVLSLENKLRKATASLDRVPGGGATSELALLSSQLDTRARTHGSAMALKRALLARAFARTLSDMCERAWREKADSLKGAGALLAPVLETGTWCDKALAPLAGFYHDASPPPPPPTHHPPPPAPSSQQQEWVSTTPQPPGPHAARSPAVLMSPQQEQQHTYFTLPPQQHSQQPGISPRAYAAVPTSLPGTYLVQLDSPSGAPPYPHAMDEPRFSASHSTQDTLVSSRPAQPARQPTIQFVDVAAAATPPSPGPAPPPQPSAHDANTTASRPALAGRTTLFDSVNHKGTLAAGRDREPNSAQPPPPSPRRQQQRRLTGDSDAVDRATETSSGSAAALDGINPPKGFIIEEQDEEDDDGREHDERAATLTRSGVSVAHSLNNGTNGTNIGSIGTQAQGRYHDGGRVNGSGSGSGDSSVTGHDARKDGGAHPPQHASTSSSALSRDASDDNAAAGGATTRHGHERSNSRVSMLAKRYSMPSPPVAPPLQSPSVYGAGSRSGSSTTSSALPNRSANGGGGPHPDVCACVQCSATKYGGSTASMRRSLDGAGSGGGGGMARAELGYNTDTRVPASYRGPVGEKPQKSGKDSVRRAILSPFRRD